MINAQVGIPTAALVFVDHDVNAMVIGERRARFPHVDDLLLVKVGTGVGAGIIATGEPCAARKAPPATSDTSAQTFTAEKIRRCAAAGNSGASRHTRVVGRSCATLPPRAAMWGRSTTSWLRCKKVMP